MSMETTVTFDRRTLLQVLAGALSLGPGPGAASAQAATSARLAGGAGAAPVVTSAWSRPATSGATGVGFMTLRNPGRTADALVAVESPIAARIEIHRSSVKAGMAMMEMSPRVPLPVGGAVTFAPGGYHLMFLNLTRPLKLGDRLPATLVFASGARIKVRFGVALSAP